MRTPLRTWCVSRVMAVVGCAVLSKLSDYAKKRDAARTNEPFGGEPEAPKATLRGRFVMHQHAATNLHWDLRLEIDGVLTSFAVPKGPTLDPEVKHLAVHTEDHPIEYLDFEDVIPEGNYGAGPMIVWDRGTVAYLEGPAHEEIARGKIDFFLRGQKLRGRFALVKLKKEKSQWLLLKKKDAYATGGSASSLDRSVLSGMRVTELVQREDREREFFERIAKAGAKRARSTAPVTAIVPAIGTLDDWQGRRGDFVDVEMTGARVLVTKSGGAVRIESIGWGPSPAPVDVGPLCPELVRAAESLPLASFVLEGELLVFDDQGYADISLLRARAADEGAPLDLALAIRDALQLGEYDVRPLPLETRRRILLDLLPDPGFLRPAQAFRGDAKDALAFATEHRLVGIVMKRAGDAYQDTSEWRSVRVASPNLESIASSNILRKRDVTITNPNKILFPAVKATKGDLARYYEAVAPFLLPYLHARPVALVRYPDGVDGNSFFQWNPPPAMPDWVRTVIVPGEEKSLRGFLLHDVRSLRYVANLAAIPLHMLGYRTTAPHEADFATIDFDVDLSTLANAVTLAQHLHSLLNESGLHGYPKTSGQSGLHVLIPLGPGQSFETARALADLLGRALVDRFPEIATMERVVKKRGAKVYVDTGQTGPSRTIVAPYSVRAVPTACVSTPLVWSEVTPDLAPEKWTIATVPARLARDGDPMSALLTDRPNLGAAIEKLAALL